MKRGDTRERIVMSAISLFGELSYNMVTLQQIAEEVGISNGSIYSHFKSKAEILDAIVDYIQQNLEYPMPEDSQVLDQLEAHGPAHVLQRYVCLPQSQNFTDHMPMYRLMYRQMFHSTNVRRLVESLLLNRSQRITRRVLEVLVEAEAIPPCDCDTLSQLWTRNAFVVSVLTLNDKTQYSDSFYYLSDHFISMAVRGIKEIDVEPTMPERPYCAPASAPHSDSVQKRILLEACRLFGENGYNETTMRQIGKACSIQVAGIYKHFASKYDILLAIVQGANSDVRRKCLLSTTAFHRCLETSSKTRLAEAMCSFNPLVTSLDVMVYRLIFREQFFHHEVREFFIRSLQNDQESMERFLEAAVAAGSIPACDCRAIATTYVYNVCSTCMGTVLDMFGGQDDSYLPKVNGMLASLIMDGFVRDPSMQAG